MIDIRIAIFEILANEYNSGQKVCYSENLLILPHQKAHNNFEAHYEQVCYHAPLLYMLNKSLPLVCNYYNKSPKDKIKKILGIYILPKTCNVNFHSEVFEETTHIF